MEQVYKQWDTGNFVNIYIFIYFYICWFIVKGDVLFSFHFEKDNCKVEI